MPNVRTLNYNEPRLRCQHRPRQELFPSRVFPLQLSAIHRHGRGTSLTPDLKPHSAGHGKLHPSDQMLQPQSTRHTFGSPLEGQSVARHASVTRLPPKEAKLQIYASSKQRFSGLIRGEERKAAQKEKMLLGQDNELKRASVQSPSVEGNQPVPRVKENRETRPCIRLAFAYSPLPTMGLAERCGKEMFSAIRKDKAKQENACLGLGVDGLSNSGVVLPYTGRARRLPCRRRAAQQNTKNNSLLDGTLPGGGGQSGSAG
ncbi:hypothetical protein O3P69_008250 [Scylla paramamosain]|uniref:Uncharacterized protein n=1 Tax=Scylla paramamosain TaxID=85552 RepID=A0AAW0T1Z1_SCYPA